MQTTYTKEHISKIMNMHANAQNPATIFREQFRLFHVGLVDASLLKFKELKANGESVEHFKNSMDDVDLWSRNPYLFRVLDLYTRTQGFEPLINIMANSKADLLSCMEAIEIENMHVVAAEIDQYKEDTVKFTVFQNNLVRYLDTIFTLVENKTVTLTPKEWYNLPNIINCLALDGNSLKSACPLTDATELQITNLPTNNLEVRS